MKNNRIKCDLCKGQDFTKLYNVKDRMFNVWGKFTLIKCKSCGLVSLDPKPNSNTLKKFYPSVAYYAYGVDEQTDFFGSLRSYLIKHYYSPTFFSRLFSFFVHKVPAMPRKCKNKVILDIGCGSGDTLYLLKKLGWNVYGIEVDKIAVNAAQKRGLNVVRGTYKNLSKYPDKFFDCIRLYHVIEHIDDSSYCLDLIKKKLKDNGELLIGTPNINSLTARVFKSYWYNMDAPRHLYLFSPKTLSVLLKRHGFQIESLGYCSAGGIVGSIQYLLSDLQNKKIDLLGNVFAVLVFYPIEWILDKVKYGDIIVARANKL